MIEINVDRKTVSVQSTQPLYAGCVDTYSCHFTFDRTWDSFSKSAVFRINGRAITTLIDDEGGCLLPWELLTRANLGYTIEIGVYGVSAESEVITSVWDELGAVRDGTELGSDAKEPYPGVYAQIMAGVKRIDGKVENYNLEARGLMQRTEASATSAISHSERATISEYQAKAAAQKASDALAGVQNAIKAIPSGGMPIVNDLTTGGVTSALSAEMGKTLNEKIKGYTFTSLSELGLSDGDMSATDFKSNIAAILAVLPNAPIVFNSPSTSNLSASLRAQLNNDLDLGIQSATPRMRLTRYGGTNVPAKIEAVVDSTAYLQIYTAHIDTTSTGSIALSKFIVSYDSAGFLMRNGGKLSGDLEIGKDTPRVILTHTDGGDLRFARLSSYGVMQVKKTAADSSSRQIRLVPYAPPVDGETTTTPLKNMAQLYSNEPGAGAYVLYGAHNKPSGSYMGTSVAWEDSLDLGAAGDALLVWNNSLDVVSLITPRGAICKQGFTISGMSSDKCSYANGVLKINAASDFVNKSGKSYSYRAL